MAGTSAQLDAMAASVRHVDTAGQTLADIHGRVQQTVAATSTGYVSDAATVFRGVMDQWHQDFAKIINGLDRIQTALTSTHQHYQSGVAEDSGSVNQIAALLNGAEG